MEPTSCSASSLRAMLGFIARDLGIEDAYHSKNAATLTREIRKAIDARADLLAALKEITCWVGQGTSAEVAGARRETLTDAIEQCNSAIAKAEDWILENGFG